MSGEVLDRPLRVIGSTRGDPTNVDVAAATAKGIPVLRTPGRNADGVAELTVALLFAVTRHLLPGDRDVRTNQIFANGSIPYQRYRAWQVAGRTAGLVGLGAVGRAVRWRLEGLGMKVIAFDPYSDEATHDSLDAMLAEADVVSMHAAPTPETLGMIGAAPVRRHARRAPSTSTRPAAACTISTRWWRPCSPATSPAPDSTTSTASTCPPATRCIDMPNVVLTPHIGGATYDTEANHTAMIAEDVRRILAGERPLHCVNPEVLP